MVRHFRSLSARYLAVPISLSGKGDFRKVIAYI
jgi:hypothetical protein